MTIRALVSLAMFLCLPQLALCKTKGPETFMRESTENILEQLESFAEKKEQEVSDDSIEQNQRDLHESQVLQEEHNAHIREELYALIESDIVPYIDIEFMAKWVAGRKIWVEATDVEKKDFVQGFKKLLIDSYANTLMILSDKNFYFKLIKSTPGKVTKAQVLCVVEQEAGGNFHVIFQMKSEADSWRIFDVVIEGISLLKALKSQFEDDFREQGIAGVTHMMEQGLYKV